MDILAYNNIGTSTAAIYDNLLLSDGLREIAAKLAADAELTSSERIAVDAYYSRLILTLLTGYLHMNVSSLSAAIEESAHKAVVLMFSNNPGLDQWWLRNTGGYPDGFAAWVDGNVFGQPETVAPQRPVKAGVRFS